MDSQCAERWLYMSTYSFPSTLPFIPALHHPRLPQSLPPRKIRLISNHQLKASPKNPSHPHTTHHTHPPHPHQKQWVPPTPAPAPAPATTGKRKKAAPTCRTGRVRIGRASGVRRDGRTKRGRRASSSGRGARGGIGMWRGRRGSFGGSMMRGGGGCEGGGDVGAEDVGPPTPL